LNLSASGELLGSIREVYEGKRTAGQDFKFQSVGQFLQLLPEKDRLEGYKLYIGCIENHPKQKSAVPYDFWNKVIPGETSLSYLRSIIHEPNSIENNSAVFLIGGYSFNVYFCCNSNQEEEYLCNDKGPTHWLCPPKETILEIVMRVDPTEGAETRDPISFSGRWESALADDAILGKTRLNKFGKANTQPDCGLLLDGHRQNNPVEYQCQGLLWSPEARRGRFYYTLYMDSDLQNSLGEMTDVHKLRDIYLDVDRALGSGFNRALGPGLMNTKDIITLRNDNNKKSNEEIDLFKSDAGTLIVTGYGMRLMPYEPLFAVYFGLESITPPPGGDEPITLAIDWYSKHKPIISGFEVSHADCCAITVSGHTDATWSGEVGRERSLAMANLVADALVKGGVPRDSMNVYGVGDADPRVRYIGQPENQRVEIKFEYK
jgi:hypothetical protein